MNKNELNDTSPANEAALYYKADDVFAVVNVVETLLEELQSADIGDKAFIRHTLTELKWVRRQIDEINGLIGAFIRQSSHSMCLTLQYTITRIREQLENFRQEVGQAAIDATKKPQSYPRSRSTLETSLYTLSLSLRQLYKHLKGLDQSSLS